MKKLLTIVAGLAAGSALYAIPVLNPAEASLLTDGVFLCGNDCWGIKVGYRGDFVFDKRTSPRNRGEVLNADGVALDFGGIEFNNRGFSQYFSNAGVLTLNLFDRIDIYGVWGEARFDVAQLNAAINLSDFDPAADPSTYVQPDFLTLSTGWNTFWGIGVRATLWECNWGNCGTTYVGIVAEYNRTQKGDLYYSSNGIPGSDINWDETTNGFSNSVVVDWVDGTVARQGINESQIALGITHRINHFAPYIAIKWSDFRTNTDGVPNGFIGVDPLQEDVTVDVFGDGTGLAQALVEQIDNHSRRNFGWAFGLTLVDCGHVDATVEARFGDERALGVAANIRF